MWKELSACLFIRIASVFVVRTWYAPDEYWQSLEVGHRLAFGYGHLTWEWTRGIRNYIHPLSIAALYRALEWLNLDQVDNLIYAPRIAQAILSAISDYCFYRWCHSSKWSFFLISTSWFWFYTASRTLLNTVETCLTVIALRLFPRYTSSESHSYLWFVVLVCFIRPTAAIIWLPLCLYQLNKSIHSVSEILIKRYLLIGLVVGGIAIALDTYAHGSFIITPVEFFKLNVLHQIGNFYGSQPWHWYFTTGLPTVLGITTIPFVIAVVQTLRNKDIYQERYILVLTVTFTLIIYSLLGHKEFRFVLPLLPICLNITSDALSRWSRNATRLTIWLVALVLLVGNAIPAIYLSTVHQRGTLDVMRPIQKIAREYRDENGKSAKLFFLMPCHSTPMYSHIHKNVTARYLTCEPNIVNIPNYRDEAEQFYAHPSNWILSHIPVYPPTALPSHVIIFDSLKPKIEDFLKKYHLLETIFHSEYVNDRVGHNVLLYERNVVKKDRDDGQFNQNPQPERINLNDEFLEE